MSRFTHEGPCKWIRSERGGEGGGVFFFFSRGDGEDEAEVIGESKVDFGARLYPALRLTAMYMPGSVSDTWHIHASFGV